ncbi:class I SAM-dependent methyltransferase [Aquisalinus flavus]|uniref:SAM-dependent methyltransferase n=1 Tax=Aquisalinus flavus TaxID=1526572 RepID=A0A8J2Y5J7_9PROT|nr:class I SAM-dependent methyltransferase [Aquisalinus flavus]MBD0425681.1 class I SAM-dependent methyltransferase [Aquisalinus flavus]UNE48707.1 class I SAM-dependent methyltransferase [Aquisalinus flavus]GGD14105.1 SAM-dependent methyltransferase [Aquisalinus flavus]
MERDEIVDIFDGERAASYDAQLANVEAMHEALILGIRVVLAQLPDDARILCVGAGTGTEIVALARHFPGWHFTALDPAGAMLDVCRDKIAKAGLSARCQFHHGFLETLPQTAPYHAATCLLVSHFFVDRPARRDFLSGIRDRLGPGGVLVTSDLSADASAPGYDPLMDAWIRFMQLSGKGPDRETYQQNIGKAVGLLPARDIEDLLIEAGMEMPFEFFRMLMIAGFISCRPGL